MEEQKCRIAYIKINGDEACFLCDDQTINANDLVVVEGSDEPLVIQKIEYVDNASLATPIAEMKRVIELYDAAADDIKEIKVLDDIKVAAKVAKDFSYADYHTDCLMKIKDNCYSTFFSLIKECKIINNSAKTFNELVVKITFSSDILKIDDINIKQVNSYSELVLRIPFLKVNKAKLEEVTEAIAVAAKFELLDASNKLLSDVEYSFRVLPISQPSSNILDDFRLYAKYVTPLASGVKQIALNAIKYNDNRSIIAYQNKGEDKYNNMLKEAQALYLALHAHGIAYQNPPASGLYNQRLRMPMEVLNDKKGTCIDLAILYCACLLEVGYNPILVIIDGHAFAGFFLEENVSFPNSIEKTCAKVYNRATGGYREIALVECTTYTATYNVSFNEALNLGINNIKGYNGKIFNAIDLASAHKGIFSPIPLDNDDNELELLIKPKEIENKKLDSIAMTKFIDVSKTYEQDRFTFWERKLLDLTEANPLVNFRLKLSNCLKLTADENIYDMLVDANSLKLAVMPENYSDASIAKEFEKGLLKPNDVFNASIDFDKVLGIGLDKTLKSLIKKSNQAMDETGAPTLYMALGILTYNRKNHEKGQAPFMVLPIKITKDKAVGLYTISYDYDDIMINQTFFEYYKEEHPNIDFSALYQVDSSQKYMDIVHTFKKNNTEDIQLDEQAFFIANLTFAHYIMWLDVRKRKNELRKNKVIESIIVNKNLLNENIDDLNKSVDLIENYEDFAAPLYYDSTQLRAILECGKGKSFILDGPPGTGKSQTIVNMIVNAFYHGKTVLFVAEKKAALDVVAQRLKKLGDPNSENNLGRFCLELHSNKANKTDFFQKLKSSMELGQIKNPEEFLNNCKSLDEKRNKLLTTINKMHQNKYFYSLYEAIVNYECVENILNVDFSEDFLTSFTNEKYNEIKELMEKYLTLAGSISYDTNPLKILNVTDVNYSEKEDAISDFNDLYLSLIKFLDSYKKILTELKIEYSDNKKTIKAIMKILDLCLNNDLYITRLSELLDTKDDDSIAELFMVAKSFVELREKLKDIFNLDLILKIDGDKAYVELNSKVGFFKKLSINKKYKRLLNSVVKPDFKIDKKKIDEYFELIGKYNKIYDYLINNSKELSKMLDIDFMNCIDDYEAISRKYSLTKEYLNSLKELDMDFITSTTIFTNIYNTKPLGLKMLFMDNKKELEKYCDLEAKISSKFTIERDFCSSIDDFINLWNYCKDPNNFNQLIDIASINKIIEQLNKLGLENITNEIKKNNLAYSSIFDAFKASLAKGYIRMYLKDSDINSFNSDVFNLEVKKYKDLINEYNNLVVANVAAKLTENLNHNNINYANSSPIGRLKKSIANNGRGVTIRDTLLNYDEVIRKYFPCFLMSPLSAAQYLAVDEENNKAVSKFDIVIFDEASQIPTHEAIGPIARGKSLIVAGDPEQMPPSAYFQAGLELSDEDIQYEDAISLLDECLTIDLPRIRLNYHYRSKHESLIAFSNYNFYNDTLFTFPSINSAKSLVEFKYVPLDCAKLNSSITKEEIDIIVDTFKEIYTNSKTMNKSVGIIAFNMKQADAIYDAIVNILADDHILSDTVAKVTEPWFVKSLENVQGDERDIIILSIGFRKNSMGRAVVLGPLARENGQRRLNVAVSRSKEKMIVVSTILPTDFDDDAKISNKGHLMLKHFLQYASMENNPLLINSDDEDKSIAYFIKRDLEKLGYDVRCNIGNSDFKIDLAIINQNKDAYDLGILIDSKPLENRSCRDQLYVFESVLNSLKWKIVDVYSIEYYKDRKKTIDKIVSCLNKPYEPEANKLNVRLESLPAKVFNYNCKAYEKMPAYIYVEYDNDKGFNYKLRALIVEVVNKEAPISFETLKDRVKENSNIKSMSDKAKERLIQTLESLNLPTTNDQYQNVYWSRIGDKQVESFRINSNRDIYDIPKEEIICAMKQIISIQGALKPEDLYKETLKALCYGQSVLNKRNIERLDYIYNLIK